MGRVPILLLVGGLVGCSASDLLTPASIAGLYRLNAIDQSPMPFVTVECQYGCSTRSGMMGWVYVTTFEEGSLTLEANGSYTLSVRISFAAHHPTLGTDSSSRWVTAVGSFTLSGLNTIEYRDSAGQTYSHAVTANRLYYPLEGKTGAFEK